MQTPELSQLQSVILVLRYDLTMSGLISGVE